MAVQHASSFNRLISFSGQVGKRWGGSGGKSINTWISKGYTRNDFKAMKKTFLQDRTYFKDALQVSKSFDSQLRQPTGMDDVGGILDKAKTAQRNIKGYARRANQSMDDFAGAIKKWDASYAKQDKDKKDLDDRMAALDRERTSSMVAHDAEMAGLVNEQKSRLSSQHALEAKANAEAKAEAKARRAEVAEAERVAKHKKKLSDNYLTLRGGVGSEDTQAGLKMKQRRGVRRFQVALNRPSLTMGSSTPSGLGIPT